LTCCAKTLRINTIHNPRTPAIYFVRLINVKSCIDSTKSCT
jgi:hypothetical protein